VLALVFALVFALVLALFATVPLSATAGAPIKAKDDSGRLLTLGKPATRLISLAPNTTELLFAIGAGADIVAVTDLSDYPAAAIGLPSVGGLAGLDLERIISLHPDLVVAWTSGNSRKELNLIENAGIPVFESDPNSVAGIAQTMQRLGRLTGHEAAADQKAQSLLAAYRAQTDVFAVKPTVSVFYEVWDEPLITLGGTHLMTSLINHCGGKNIFAEVTALAPSVSAEAVIARHPDVIVTDPGEVSHLAKLWQQRAQGDPAWHAHIVGIDPDLLTRAGPRIVDGAKALCNALDAARASSLSAPATD